MPSARHHNILRIFLRFPIPAMPSLCEAFPCLTTCSTSLKWSADGAGVSSSMATPSIFETAFLCAADRPCLTSDWNCKWPLRPRSQSADPSTHPLEAHIPPLPCALHARQPRPNGESWTCNHEPRSGQAGSRGKRFRHRATKRL
eukprot:15450477-Alexandrium_andersonii.AAC.1